MSRHTKPRRVLVLQPYVPDYRVEFFHGVASRLAEYGLELRVLSGLPTGDQAARGDVAEPHPWHRVVPAVRHLPGRLRFRRIPKAELSQSVVVVTELASSSLNSWRLAMHRLLRPGWRLVVWGHVNNYVTPSSWYGGLSKRILVLLSDGVLAYTADGAVTASSWVRRGTSVTALNNSRASPPALPRLPNRRPRLMFVGGLDASKRLDQVLFIGAALAELLPDFELVILGDGPDRALIEDADLKYRWLRYVGRQQGEEKARLAAECSGILMPGRVGLVVIDSFSMELPILTQRWRFHAPEFSYLTDRVNALISDDVDGLISNAYQLLTDEQLLERLRSGCAEGAATFSLQHMVDRFIEIVVQESRSRRQGLEMDQSEGPAVRPSEP